MTDRRARIRRDVDTCLWTVELPAFGFGQPQRKQFTDWRSAVRWLDQRIPRQASLGAVAERGPRPASVSAKSRADIRPYWWT